MKYDYKPSPKELRSSLKSRSREYFLENSLHGVQYIVDPTRPAWERITWLLLTLSSLGATIGTIVIIWRKFQTEPTITGLEPETVAMKLQFPQILLCYEWSQLNTSHLSQSEIPVYKMVYEWSWYKPPANEKSERYKDWDKFSEVFKTISPDCGVVLDNCEFNEVKESCGAIFEQVLTPAGACCKYNSSKRITVKDDPWEFKFESLTYPMRLFFLAAITGHPQRGERPMLILNSAVSLRFEASVTYAVSSIRYLSRRQRKCYFGTEQKSYSECVNDCLKGPIQERCHCQPWYLKNAREQECPLSKYNCVREAKTAKSMCPCMLPCSFTSFIPKKVAFTEGGVKVNSIMMMNWPWTIIKRETRFGYLDLLVSFGGIGGLFLGYSLLTSVELGYYFTLRTYCGAVVNSSRKKHNIQTVHVKGAKKKPTTPDVKPIYYLYAD